MWLTLTLQGKQVVGWFITPASSQMIDNLLLTFSLIMRRADGELTNCFSNNCSACCIHEQTRKWKNWAPRAERRQVDKRRRQGRASYASGSHTKMSTKSTGGTSLCHLLCHSSKIKQVVNCTSCTSCTSCDKHSSWGECCSNLEVLFLAPVRLNKSSSQA